MHSHTTLTALTALSAVAISSPVPAMKDVALEKRFGGLDCGGTEMHLSWGMSQ
jgi:hypothetical protein